MSPEDKTARREKVKALCAEQAWVEQAGCPHCGGTGKSDEVGRRLIHCVGEFTGADWDLDAVQEAIDGAAQVAWIKGFMGHDLVVQEPDGQVWRFQVSRPEVSA